MSPLQSLLDASNDRFDDRDDRRSKAVSIMMQLLPVARLRQCDKALTSAQDERDVANRID